MGYVPTGGSGGASIGGSVSGATAGSVFFAGAAGVLAQNNTRFFWDDTNFNLIAGGATYRTILGQMSSPSDNYSGIRFAGAGEAVLGTSNAALWGGANATVLNVPSGTIYFRVGGSTNYVTLDTTSFTAKAASASRVPLTVELAAAQSADAFQVKNSGGTTIAYIDANGYYNGQNGSTTRIQNTSIATVGMLLDAGNTRIGAYEGTNYWSLLTSTEIRQKSGSQFSWSSDGTSAVSASADTGLARSAVGIVKITNGSTGAGALHLQEQTAPSAPATNNVYLYAEDNGAGKTRIVALFPTGAAQVLATEP